jgi:hypothetical protein
MEAGKERMEIWQRKGEGRLGAKRCTVLLRLSGPSCLFCGLGNQSEGKRWGRWEVTRQNTGFCYFLLNARRSVPRVKRE